MLRSVRWTCVVSVLVLAAPLLAQSRPNLAGKWVLVVEKSTPPTAERHGPEITITQDAETITLTQTAFVVGGTVSPGGGVSSTTREKFEYSTTYTADGAEHPTPKRTLPKEMTAQASAPPPGAAVMGSVQAGESTYRAIWTRDQLVIMSRETTNLTSPSAAPRSINRMSRRALSLDAEGLLVVDLISLVDPTPNGPTQPAPAPLRSVYRKVS